MRSEFAELAGIAYARDPVNALRVELMQAPPDKWVACVSLLLGTAWQGDLSAVIICETGIL